MEHFIDGYFDEDENLYITFEYRISNKYFYMRLHKGDQVFSWKRISESAYITAYEGYMNY